MNNKKTCQANLRYFPRQYTRHLHDTYILENIHTQKHNIFFGMPFTESFIARQ